MDKVQSEEDLENETITPEVVTTNKDLMLFLEESELEPAKQQFLIDKYADHFKMAAEWAKKAKKIIVTNESQTVIMEEAKVARLFLRKKRLEIENSRKLLKAGALKECQVIDRAANFLKDVIIPTEEHLERQEKFIEFKKKAEDERILSEAHAKMEAEALAEQHRLAEETKRIKEENEILRKENEEINRKRMEELAKIQKENEAILAKERYEREKAEAELRAKQQAEAKAEADRLKKEADRIRAEEALLSADDETKMQAFRREVESIKIPEVKSAINKRIIDDAKSHLFLAISKIKIQEEE